MTTDSQNSNMLLINVGKCQRYDLKPPYRWVVVEPYQCTWRCRTVHVPVGFLTDGATGGPDLGSSWVFHDFLYATHRFTTGEECCREEADALMYMILMCEGYPLYAHLFRLAIFINPLWCFNYAWKSSGIRGAEYK